uniref:Uncharacterized protein n=1 Tax=Oryza barthii TaxID=65489 RepID=A0A679BAY6_9ORYZ|nr:hypothetical protein [Oryza barthii]
MARRPESAGLLKSTKVLERGREPPLERRERPRVIVVNEATVDEEAAVAAAEAEGAALLGLAEKSET